MTPKPMSIAGHVWAAAIARPFVVRATVGRVANEKVGAYATVEEARAVARDYPDGRIVHAVSGAEVQ